MGRKITRNGIPGEHNNPYGVVFTQTGYDFTPPLKYLR
jgi:hypothetical protein